MWSVAQCVLQQAKNVWGV